MQCIEYIQKTSLSRLTGLFSRRASRFGQFSAVFLRAQKGKKRKKPIIHLEGGKEIRRQTCVGEKNSSFTVLLFI
jgi:hypothetical protein